MCVLEIGIVGLCPSAIKGAGCIAIYYIIYMQLLLALAYIISLAPNIA